MRSLFLRATVIAFPASVVVQIIALAAIVIIQEGAVVCNWQPMHGTRESCNLIELAINMLVLLPSINFLTAFAPMVASFAVSWIGIYLLLKIIYKNRIVEA